MITSLSAHSFLLFFISHYKCVFTIYFVLMLNIGAVRNIKNSEEKLVVYCHSTMLFFMCVFLCIFLFGSIFFLCLILLDHFYGMETKTMVWYLHTFMQLTAVG